MKTLPESSGDRRVPRVVIELALGRGPTIYTDTVGDTEASLLCDWITAHDDLADLLGRALESRESWRRNGET
jgi:hypothetical protein